MAEVTTLTTPIARTSTQTYQVQYLVLDRRNGGSIVVGLVANTGDIVIADYQGATALTLINQLNKLDLSSNSLERRIMNRLIADGKLPTGSITGVPD